MANEDLGTIKCGWCETEAVVRKASRGKRKLYVYCPNCGQQWLNLPGGQDIILNRAIMVGPEPELNPEPEPPQPESKRPGFLDWVGEDLL